MKLFNKCITLDFISNWCNVASFSHAIMSFVAKEPNVY